MGGGIRLVSIILSMSLLATGCEDLGAGGGVVGELFTEDSLCRFSTTEPDPIWEDIVRQCNFRTVFAENNSKQLPYGTSPLEMTASCKDALAKGFPLDDPSISGISRAKNNFYRGLHFLLFFPFVRGIDERMFEIGDEYFPFYNTAYELFERFPDSHTIEISDQRFNRGMRDFFCSKVKTIKYKEERFAAASFQRSTGLMNLGGIFSHSEDKNWFAKTLFHEISHSDPMSNHFECETKLNDGRDIHDYWVQNIRDAQKDGIEIPLQCDEDLGQNFSRDAGFMVSMGIGGRIYTIGGVSLMEITQSEALAASACSWFLEHVNSLRREGYNSRDCVAYGRSVVRKQLGALDEFHRGREGLERLDRMRYRNIREFIDKWRELSKRMFDGA